MDYFEKGLMKAGLNKKDLLAKHEKYDELNAPPKQEDVGVLDGIWNAAKNFPNTFRANFGTGLNLIGDLVDTVTPDNPNHLAVPALNKISETFHGAGDYVSEGAEDVTPDYTNPVSAVLSGMQGGYNGVIAGLASMLKQDNSADTLNTIAQKMADPNAREFDWSLDYFADPHGFWQNLGQMGGSMIPMLAAGAAVPEGLAASIASRAGGNAIVRGLLGSGNSALRRKAARAAADMLPAGVRYGMGSAPLEGLSEGGHVRMQSLKEGKSDEEATAAGLKTAAMNVPALLVTNTIEGGLLRPFRGIGFSPASIAANFGVRPLTSGAVQGTEEAIQNAISSYNMGKEYGINPMNWTPQQTREFWDAFIASAALGELGGLGSVRQFTNENVRNYEKGDSSNLSVKDYKQRYDKAQNDEKVQDYYDTKQLNSYKADRGNLVNWAENLSGSKNTDTINKVIDSAKRHGVDPRLALALANAESGFNQGAGSEAGAIGVMQLMPETAAGLGVDPYNEDENIEGGMKFLKQMLDEFGGNQQLAAAAYNAGPGAVHKYGGVPPYGETQAYVKRIFSALDESPEYSGGEISQQQSQQQGNTLKIMPQTGKECTLEAMAAIYNAYTGENTAASDWDFSGSNWWYGNLKNGQLQAKEYNFSSSEREQFEQTIKDHFDKHPNSPIFLYQAGGAGSSGNHSLNRVSGTHATVIGRRLDNGKYQVFDSNGGMTHELELSEIFDPTANGGDSLSGMNVGEGNTLLIPSIDPAKEITNWQTAEGNVDGSSSQTSRTPSTLTNPTTENVESENETQNTPIDYSDIDAETQKQLDEFVFNKKEKASDEEKGFFDSISNENGQVNINEENLKALAEKYGDEITSQAFWKELNKPVEVKTPQQQQQQAEKPESYEVTVEMKNLEGLKQRQKYFAETKNAPLLSQAIELENSDTNTIQKFLRENPLPADFVNRWNKENVDETTEGAENAVTTSENNEVAAKRTPKKEIPQKALDVANAEIDDNSAAKRKSQFNAFSLIADAYGIKLDADLKRLGAKGYKQPLSQIKQKLMSEGVLTNDNNPSALAANKTREYKKQKNDLDRLAYRTKEILSVSNDTATRRKALRNFAARLDEVKKLQEEMWGLSDAERKYRQNLRTEKQGYNKTLEDYQNELDELTEQLKTVQQTGRNAQDETTRKQAKTEFDGLQKQVKNKKAELEKYKTSDDYAQELIDEYNSIAEFEIEGEKRNPRLGQIEKELQAFSDRFNTNPAQQEVKTETPAPIQQENSQIAEESPQQEKTVENPVQETPQEISQPVAAEEVTPPNPTDYRQQKNQELSEQIKRLNAETIARADKAERKKAKQQSEEQPTSIRSYHFDGSQAEEQQEIEPAENIVEVEEQAQGNPQVQEVEEEKPAKKSEKAEPSKDVLQELPKIHEKLKTDSHPNLKSFVDKQAEILRENPNDEGAKGELQQILSREFNDEDLQAFEEQAGSQTEETPAKKDSEVEESQTENETDERGKEETTENLARIYEIIVGQKLKSGRTQYYVIDNYPDKFYQISYSDAQKHISQGIAIPVGDASENLKLKIAVNQLFDKKYDRFKNHGNKKYSAEQFEKAKKIVDQLNSDEISPNKANEEIEKIFGENADKYLNRINHFISTGETKFVNEKSQSKQDGKEDFQSREKGNLETINTDYDSKVKIRYKIAESDEIITSHNWEGDLNEKNPDYPKGLQPRDREELLTIAELKERAKKLDPTRLAAGENVNQGAAVVRNDGVVLNGNGRILTIRWANSHYKDRADEYKQYLIDNAEKYGLNSEEISKMREPVLVREVEENLDEELTQDIITSRTGGTSMKQEESAKIDAKKIRDKVIDDYVEGGTLPDLRRDIIDNIVPFGDTRRNGLFDGNILNQNGIITADNALFALAYGDEHLITKLANGSNDVSNTLKNALLEAAPHIAVANRVTEKVEYNLGKVIADAINNYVAERKKAKSKADMNQWVIDNRSAALFDPIQKAKVDIFDFVNRNSSKGNTIREFLREIANRVSKQNDDSKQGFLIDVSAFNQRIDEITAEVMEEYDGVEIASLFDVEGEIKNPIVTEDMLVADKDLTPQQKTFTEWADSLGMTLNYFKGEKGFRGVNEGNTSKLNVNNRDLEQTFWHETTHYLANNNPEMFAEILKEGKITENERRLMRQKSPMYEKLSNDELDEEILADNFMDIAKRAGLLQKIGRQDKSLAERFISWLKSLMDKFTSFFSTPKGGLTRTQRNAMYGALKRNIDSMVDADGRRIFRMSRETFEIQRTNGEKLPAVPLKPRREIKARYSVNSSNNSDEDGKLAKLSDWIRTAWKGKSKEKRWRNEVTKLIQRATGYKIAYRHFDGDDTVMIDTVAKLITVDGAYKFDELMPKAAKIIAKKVGLPQTDEMQNYIAEWVLRGTPTNSPQETQLFEKAMAENPKVYEQLRKAQEIFQDVAHMSALDKYGSIIAYEKPNPETQSLKEKIKENLIDDTAPLGKLTDEIREKYGDKIADALDSQFAARMYRGGGGIIELMTRAKNNQQVKDIRELLNLEMPFIKFDNFTPIEQIIKMAGGREKLRKLDGYLVALQEKEFHEKNRQAGEKIYETIWDEKTCDDAIKEGESEFGAAQQAYLNYTNILLDIAYDSGLISKKQYFAIKNSWKNYATTARVFDDATEIDVDSFMPKKGSKRDVFTPITALINNTEKILKAAQKNRIKNHLAQLARCEGFGKHISEVEARNGNEPTITYKENGKKKYLATTPEVKRVIDSLDGNSTQANFVARAIQTASAWVSNTYTLFSLDFSAGNLFRDTQEAYLYGENHAKTFGGILKHHILNNPIANLARAIKMLPHIWNKSALYLEWKAMGGSQATFVSPDMNRSQIRIDDLTKSRKEKFFKSGVRGFLEQCLTSMQTFSEFTEEMTRLAVYKSAKDALANQKGGKATYGDMKKAAFASRNATIDFARGGRSMKEINKYFRFSNVAIQDMDKSWTVAKNLNPYNLKSHEGRLKFFDTALKLFFGVMLPTVVFWEWNHDKDWYKHGTPQWQKDTSWILGEGVKIPKSLSLFGKVASMIVEESLNENPTSAKRIAQPFLESLPSLLPTLLIPITESLTNYSFFYGGSLVPQKEQRLPAYSQYSRNTSELAKMFGDSALAHGISKALYDKDDGISPRKIDHILEGYLGFIGKGIEGFSNAVTTGRKISFESSEFPILKRFSFDPYKNPQIVADYYNKRSEQEKFYNEYKENRRQGKKEVPDGFDLKLYKRIQSVEKAMQNISARERKLLENPNIPADELKEQIHELEKKRIELAKKALGRN